jgi:hypothetical protein
VWDKEQVSNKNLHPTSQQKNQPINQNRARFDQFVSPGCAIAWFHSTGGVWGGGGILSLSTSPSAEHKPAPLPPPSSLGKFLCLSLSVIMSKLRVKCVLGFGRFVWEF